MPSGQRSTVLNLPSSSSMSIHPFQPDDKLNVTLDRSTRGRNRTTFCGEPQCLNNTLVILRGNREQTHNSPRWPCSPLRLSESSLASYLRFARRAFIVTPMRQRLRFESERSFPTGYLFLTKKGLLSGPCIGGVLLPS
jgi:hypothetical protein